MKLPCSVVFITGGAIRVGRAIALRLGSCGADLILHYNRSKADAVRLQKLIQKKYGRRVDLIQGNLSKVGEVRRIAKEVWQRRGRLDAVINNASTFYPTPLGKVTEEQWEDLFSINVRAPFFLNEYLGLKMKARGKGKIINIADWSALQPYTQYVPYCASKAALIAVSQGMAKTLAPEVQVNTILPGPVLWPKELNAKVKASVIQKTPLQRIGTPEDIAQAAEYLITGSDFMTGTLLHVDGGRHL